MRSCAAPWMEWIQRLVTELAEYYEKKIGYHLPSSRPRSSVRNFIVTKVGIHADGLLKNEEIFTIYLTLRNFNRPLLVSPTRTAVRLE